MFPCTTEEDKAPFDPYPTEREDKVAPGQQAGFHARDKRGNTPCTKGTYQYGTEGPTSTVDAMTKLTYVD